MNPTSLQRRVSDVFAFYTGSQSRPRSRTCSAAGSKLHSGRKKPQAWDAKTIEWQKVDSDGTKWAVLEGRSNVSGEAFTYAVFVPAGFHEHHRHASDARVAVVQGVLNPSSRIAAGEKRCK